MGGSVNEPNLAKEWQYPGMQARQPLAKGNNQQDAMSSTDSLHNDFFGEGGLSALLAKAVGNDPIPNFGDSGGGFGDMPSNGGNAPFMSTPPANFPSYPTESSTGSSSGGWTNAGMGSASVSGNSLSELSNAFGNMGGIFNTDFFSHNTTPEGGVNNTSWMDSNSMFSNDSILGSYLSDDMREGVNNLSYGNKVANAFGYGNKDLSGALSIAGASPRSLVNAYAGYTDNAALGMLTGDFSQRGITNAALQQSGMPYGGAVMGLADYGMGYNNYGALGSTIGGLFGPVGAAVGGLFGHNLQGYYGADKDATTVDKYNESYLSKYNDNYGTYEGDVAANQYARDFGLEPGTHEFDRAVDGFKTAYTKNKDFRGWYEDNYPSAVEDSKAGTITPINNVQDAIANKVPYGKEGDDTWTDGTTTFHSGGYNWNGTTNTGTDSFGNDISSGSDSSSDDSGGWGDSDSASDMDSDSGWSGADSDWD